MKHLINDTPVPQWLKDDIIELRNGLFLQAWTIHVELCRVIDNDESIMGQADLEETMYHRASLKFRDDIEDNEFWRHVIIHEMVEIALSNITIFFADVILPQLPECSRDMADTVYTQHKEQFIERIVESLKHVYLVREDDEESDDDSE